MEAIAPSTPYDVVRKEKQMKEVKVMPRFKCDFCKHRSTKASMLKHEGRCFRNPNRYCDYCQNKGETEEGVEHYTYKVPCPYCSKRDPKITEAINKHYETVG